MSTTPVFLAQGINGHVTMDYPHVVQAYVRSLAGDRETIDLEITITEAGTDKTRAQEAGFHAMITPWAHQRGESVDMVKQFCLAQAFGTHQFTHAGTGLVFDVLAEPRSSKLSRKKYALLIETAMQLAAEDRPSCILMPPDEYRRAREGR